MQADSEYSNAATLVLLLIHFVKPLKQFQMEVVAAKFYKSNATNIYQKFYIPNKLLIYIQDKSKRIDEIIREEGTCLGTLSDNGKYIIL